MKQMSLEGLRLADADRFDTFFSGQSQQAVTAVKAFAEGDAADHILYLHGPPGTGKTHLLRAAWRCHREQGRQAAYLPLGDAFMLDPALIDGWGRQALVCIDQVEYIAGFDAWERGLFQLLEEIKSNHGHVVAAGRHPPKSVGIRLPDLVSRLAWGPIFALSPLDDADLVALVRTRAKGRGLDMPESTAKYLMKRLERDPTQLVEFVADLDLASLEARRRLTIPFVREFLSQR